ncbi:hypothetical protein [Legionella bononiensis]|uniref:Uncharacterized protein n=1 Tax=Legionella bononiensis TaxID=2793102 RepID=A0ABS1W762_9GAMM|nr:hypothetical protein [Legionella bononiensis]MBL7481286.1 hypothetical protein [Legionella bononiensis]MBL7525190.1 hypothetical protein [Legionella bononiensis]MBL7561373.1 hypothetical protein [Legionella bononiensis]
MISMTTYWQQYKDCIDSLPADSTGNEEYSRQIATANKLIAIGLTIEKLGITEIKQVVNSLHTIAKDFNHQVVYKAPDKEYKFSLPKITNPKSLIFAILYFQHLSNYAEVSYQGSINFFMKGFVTSAVNDKKKPTANQANAMLVEIKNYCQSQNIELDETQLLNKNKEAANDYVSRLVSTFLSVKPEQMDLKSSDEPVEAIEIQKSIEDQESSSEERADLTRAGLPLEEVMHAPETTEDLTQIQVSSEELKDEPEELPRIESPLKELKNTSEDLESLAILRMSLEDLDKQKVQLQLKIDLFSTKRNQLEQAKQYHLKVNQEWQNTGFITKFFYWLISWAIEIPLLKNIKTAEQNVHEKEASLNQDIPSGKTSDSYLGELTLELEQLNSSSRSIGDKIEHQIKIERAKQDALKQEQLRQEQLKQEELSKQKALKSKALLDELLGTPRSSTDIFFSNRELNADKLGTDTLHTKKMLTVEPEKMPTSEPEQESESQSTNINSNHGFFKQYMPSKMTLQAAAVAGAAIVIQNMLYGS